MRADQWGIFFPGALLGMALLLALVSVWILLKAQLDILEATVRSITDILWSASSRLRAWRGGDVRAVYFGVLAVVVSWGVVAIGLSQPIVLLQVAANVAGFVMTLGALHILRVNTTLLPPALRPSRGRQAVLVAMAVFYGSFVWLWLVGGVVPDSQRGFLFALARRVGRGLTGRP